MKKYFIVLLLMFLCVTSVFADGLYGSVIEEVEGGVNLYDYTNNTSSYYSSAKEQVKQDYSWLTKRWVDKYGNCIIKGNISYKSGDKIYHIPGWKDYNATKINTEYGERWFCTEWEAYKAGWRAPYYANRPKVYPNPYGN